MPFIQILLTAASLTAIAGGTWTVDRAMERYGRIPAAEESVIRPSEETEDEASEESQILY